MYFKFSSWTVSQSVNMDWIACWIVWLLPQHNARSTARVTSYSPKPSTACSRAGAAATGYQSALLAVGLDGEHATSPDLTYSTATGLKMKVASPLLCCEAKRVNSWKHLWPSTIPLCVCVCVCVYIYIYTHTYIDICTTSSLSCHLSMDT